jgi:peptidoglycan/LPS O-acetylase OafA/YrhL
MAAGANASQTSDDGKIVGIELLRFASAVAVLVFHYQHFAYGGKAVAEFVAQKQPFYPLLKLFYDSGFYGVQVFWCISGFIFFWKYGTQIVQEQITGRRFFVLRLSRLYPLHFLTLLFVASMQIVYFAQNSSYFVYQNNDLYHFVLQLGMASNWGLQVGDSFNGPIWSISVEVLVYAIFFCTLRYISGSVATLALIVLGTALVQVLKVSEHPVFSCLMFFHLGCLTAVGYLKVKATPALQKPVSAVAAAAVIAAALAGFLSPIRAKYLLFVLSPALIYLCVTHIRATAWNSRLLVHAGNMTYSSYLLHVPIQITVVTICTYTSSTLPFYSPYFFLGYIVVTLALSAWSYKYVEMPLQTLLRKRLMPRRPEAARSLA